MKPLAKGLGVSKGKATGKVRIIKNFDDHANFKQGDILVTKITDPTMTVIMGKAAGIICDVGSMASHPSILSREMGIPCIVSARSETGKPVTEILKDGQEIEICGERGEIFAREPWKLKWR